MKKQPWNLPKRVTAAALTVAVLAIYQIALAAKTDEWTPPLTVDNPFFVPVSPTDTAPHVRSDESGRAIVGGPVEPALPPIYRLPPIDAGTEQRGIWIPAAPVAAPPLGARREVAPDDDILPLPNEPSDDMLQMMEDLLRGPAFDETTPARDEAAATLDEPAPAFDEAASAFDEPAPPLVAVAPTPDIAAPALDEATYAYNAAAAFPYTPMSAELSLQLLPPVRKAFGLAQRGAMFAAQTEFIQVLRRIAQAKDAELGTDEHSRYLAAGLRALDEADDFTPDGVELEAEMNVAVIASSHRTPVLADRVSSALPHEAIALYHQYAEVELGRAVAGERAGAMALYGLGKVYNRLMLEADGDPQHRRKAMTMFLASLAAAPDNHLAANEVGVLLSRTGHHDEAAAMFKRAIDVAPTSTSYHNLAVVEGKLGRLAEATANERYAQQLAARDRATGEVSRRQGIAWVPPGELARVQQPRPLPPAQMPGQQARQLQAAAAPPGSRPTPPKSAWQKTVELAKALPLPGKAAANDAASVRVAQPNRSAGPQWR